MPDVFAELGKLGSFVLTTLWVHGPWSPLLPAAYEPVLLLFGKLYPPLLIAVVGAVLSVVMEAINYRVYDWMAGWRRLETFRQKAVQGRLVHLFERRPFLVVWLFAVSPVPDWAARVLAVLAEYPIRRYLLAFLLGRIPKFWAFAALGEALPLSDRTVLIGAIAVTGLFLVIGLWKAKDEQRGAREEGNRDEGTRDERTRDEGPGSRDEGQTSDKADSPLVPRP
ncbi:MAG TPA: VTT domain-containing protein [Gaiellaceae bacterium]|nr:VTT domain-containing protein [Gaiellaceae bacterium]